MGDPGRAGERASRGYGSVGDVDRSKVSGAQEKAHRQAIKGAQDYNQGKKDITKPNLVGNIVTGVITKALDLPFGALSAVKNVVGPLTSGVRDKVTSITGVKGQNLNDYSPARTISNIGPKFSGLGDNTTPTQQKGLCPDGSMPPCPVVTAKNGKSIRVRGTKAAIRGTGFKGVF